MFYAYRGYIRAQGPLLLTLKPIWISNDICNKVQDEITYPFPNANGTPVEVWKWISNLHPTFYNTCYYCETLNVNLYQRSKRYMTQDEIWVVFEYSCIFLAMNSHIMLVYQANGLIKLTTWFPYLKTWSWLPACLFAPKENVCEESKLSLSIWTITSYQTVQ